MNIKISLTGSSRQWRVLAEYRGLYAESGTWSSKKEAMGLLKYWKKAKWFINNDGELSYE
jgi:hypothetical protein